MAKHTEGPWRVGDAGCAVFGPKTDAPSPKTIACLSKVASAPEETRANARLIAAAPELLDALKAMLAGAQEAAWTEGWGDDVPEEVLAARKAVARAEGRA